jgi:small subunit ribosomal protein S16
MGKKKQPIYKIVAADSRSPRDGKFLEAVGFYNPLTDPHTLELKEDRILYWLNTGAQPTSTVKSLLRQKGLTLKKELTSKGLDEEKVNAEIDNWKKMKEAGTKKKTGKKLSRKAKAKQETEASTEKTEEKQEEKPEEKVEDKALVEETKSEEKAE